MDMRDKNLTWLSGEYPLSIRPGLAVPKTYLGLRLNISILDIIIIIMIIIMGPGNA